MTSLNNSPIGKEQTVTWISGDYSTQESIRNAGITEGSTVKVISSFFGNVIIALKESRIALDNDLAYSVKVG